MTSVIKKKYPVLHSSWQVTQRMTAVVAECRKEINKLGSPGLTSSKNRTRTQEEALDLNLSYGDVEDVFKSLRNNITYF